MSETHVTHTKPLSRMQAEHGGSKVTKPIFWRSFSLSRNKKISWKPSSGRSQEMTCYKRLIFKQFTRVSGLCVPQFLSYLPKRFTHLCRYRALYGDAILVHQYGRRKSAKHLEYTFSTKAPSFQSRTSIRAHKHIFQYLDWLYCWKWRGNTFFSTSLQCRRILGGRKLLVYVRTVVSVIIVMTEDD